MKVLFGDEAKKYYELRKELESLRTERIKGIFEEGESVRAFDDLGSSILTEEFQKRRAALSWLNT
ncbi:MAG: hypothetical protein HPY53_12455 [Brevinematales bacterium]|nr:hypothetical protein [Brevinematales bacterium]